MFIFKLSKQLSVVALVSIVLVACSNSSDNNDSPDSSYSADIVWTEYGIPHITAQTRADAAFAPVPYTHLTLPTNRAV